MRTRRLQAMFLLASLGVLVVVGLLVLAACGVVVALVYAAVVLGLLALGAFRARAAAAPVGRTCSCCTTTVHDPVQVR